MATPITTTLPDFIVMIDRAAHLVVERVEGTEVTRTIDFGTRGQVARTVDMWLELGETLGETAMNALVPAMNDYLTEQFARA
jgi:hypothetical protein